MAVRSPCSFAPFKSILPLIFGLQCSAAGRRGIHLSCFPQLSGCWHCCLPLDVSPTRPTRGLVCSRNALLYLLHCFHAAQRVDSTCSESTTYMSTSTILVLENCTLCVQCHVCSRSTQGSVCQRVHHYNHVCVQTTADLLLLDWCSPVHCYRKQETEVQF